MAGMNGEDSDRWYESSALLISPAVELRGNAITTMASPSSAPPKESEERDVDVGRTGSTEAKPEKRTRTATKTLSPKLDYVAASPTLHLKCKCSYHGPIVDMRPPTNPSTGKSPMERYLSEPTTESPIVLLETVTAGCSSSAGRLMRQPKITYEADELYFRAAKDAVDGGVGSTTVGNHWDQGKMGLPSRLRAFQPTPNLVIPRHFLFVKALDRQIAVVAQYKRSQVALRGCILTEGRRAGGFERKQNGTAREVIQTRDEVEIMLHFLQISFSRVDVCPPMGLERYDDQTLRTSPAAEKLINLHQDILQTVEHFSPRHIRTNPTLAPTHTSSRCFSTLYIRLSTPLVFRNGYGAIHSRNFIYAKGDGNRGWKGKIQPMLYVDAWLEFGLDATMN
ncbi:hypothetical protein DM02DRAFT_626326 [Periconia macrospinosa]|uniref:Uncharacterized protein n=1 Tax=Periconia macrospinosa TaxID=97972 RepID=A0A2V1DXP2_9PLEO|nr:hypothetical protein DM02DRAFT_626326 [Periconia macrospinosa]